MEDETKYRMLMIAMLFIFLLFGFYFGFKYTSNSNIVAGDDSTTVVNKDDNLEVSIYSDKENKKDEKEEKTYDIEVILKTFYSLCNETITKEEEKKNTTKEKIKVEYDEYEVIDEKEDKITLSRTLNQNCPNHFLVKFENGSVVIYNVVDELITTLYKKIDISSDLIRSEMLEELNDGIRVDTKEDLNMLIEDIES